METVLSAPPRTPQSVRRAMLAGPVACACGLAAAAAYVAIADPMAPGTHLPACPLYELTGLYCPGCGLTRATHAFLRGHLGAALGYNILFPFFIAAIVLGWWAWVRRTLGRTPFRWVSRLSPTVGIASIAVLIVFGVIRNFSPFHALAP
ncbi:MAG: hypothetical protein JWM34_1248 [Ilumatobacteraceae bacterium]|nr:hypothetical protein [Ilumatobacteraceae bacterium]